MNKNLGFTFIELIIVFSIIMLVSVLSIGQFNSFLDTNYIEVHSQEIYEVIDSLDSAVKKGEIYDYSLFFSTGSWYMYSVNNTGPYTISFNPTPDYFWYSGTVISNSTDPWVTLSLKTYDGIKIEKNVLYISTWSYNIWFWKNRDYTLKTSFSWTGWNSIFLKFYSEDNLISQKIIEKRLILEGIKDTGGNILPWIILKNINNKKTLTESWWTTLYNKVDLFFSRGWIGKVLEITNQ